MEHGLLEDEPCLVGIGDAADGALGDAGVSWEEAVAGGFHVELVPLGHAAADAVAEEGFGAGDPGAFEGVDEGAGGVAEDSVFEGEGFVADLAGMGRLVADKFQADVAQAFLGQVDECLHDGMAIGCGEIPLEEGEVDSGAVIAVDASDGAGGGAESGERAGGDFRKEGEGGGWWVGGWRIGCSLGVLIFGMWIGRHGRAARAPLGAKALRVWRVT